MKQILSDVLFAVGLGLITAAAYTVCYPLGLLANGLALAACGVLVAKSSNVSK